MKKLICIVLLAVLTVSLVACSTTRSSETTQQTPSASTTGGAEQKTDGKAGGKTLVAYFSATGTTKNVAELIAQATGATLYEIIPSEPYTDDDLNYRNSDSRVSREHSDASLRTVELSNASVPNWDEYDTVYIGYPIWWGEASWVVTSFVAANDFSGKTVVPFCTSASSSLGNSASDLAKTANSGEWKDGKRFGASADADDIAAWLSEIG